MIRNNPHYKPSAKQLAEEENQKKEKHVEFGEVPLHNTVPNLHDTPVPKKSRGRPRKNSVV